MNSMKKSVVGKAFKELYCASKRKYILVYSLTLIQGLSKILPIVTIQQLFDHLEFLKETDGISRIFPYLAALVGARCFCHLLDLLTNYVYEAYNNFSGYKMNDNVNQTVWDIPAINYESPAFLDCITKAYRGTSSIRSFVDTWMMILLLYVPELVTIIIYLYCASKFLPCILLFIIIPTFFILKIQEKEYAIQEENVSILQRKNEVYQEQAFHLKSAIESAVWGYTLLMKEKISKCNEKTAAYEFAYDNKKNRFENYQKILSLGGYSMIFASLSYCVTKGFVTIGLFSALITSMDELFALMEVMISMISAGMSEELEKIRNYCILKEKFHQSAEHEGMVLDDEIRKIEFQNVSFSYPGREKKAIDNVSFIMKSNERIAIVGKNGSGKSTLLKLLSGIYECDTGRILVNDIDIKNIDKQSLYGHFSAVFQNYGRYAVNLSENISLSEESKDNYIEDLMNRKGLAELRNIDKDVILSREFGGQDLSGGQWQRIAIARGYYHNRDCYLLDEPTSAIDPNEERTFYELFEALMRQKMGLIVTHRMGFAQLSDRILVIKDGRLSGDGKHKDLLEKCRDYQELWFSQANIYLSTDKL